jgi:hypothetical protein
MPGHTVGWVKREKKHSLQTIAIDRLLLILPVISIPHTLSVILDD